MDVQLQRKRRVHQVMQLNSRNTSVKLIYKNPHLRDEIRRVQNKINHIRSVGDHELYDSMRRTQRGCAPGREQQYYG